MRCSDSRLNGWRLSAEQIEERLDELLDAVLSSRRVATGPARALAGFTPSQQEFALHWVAVIAKTNSEMGYQFVANVHRAFEQLDLPAVEEWIVRAMDVYDRQGLYPGSAVFRDIDGFVAEHALGAVGVRFDDIAGMLQKYLCGLAGRELKLTAGESVYTDTETLFLPAVIARFDERESNKRLYKAMVAHLWAQTWFGTFRADTRASLADALRRYPNRTRATGLFHALETIRLDACIARELPGLAREMSALQDLVGQPQFSGRCQQEFRRLRQSHATVQDTLASLERLYAAEARFGGYCYQGEIRPDQAAAAVDLRIEREKLRLRSLIAKLADDIDGRRKAADQANRESLSFTVERTAEATFLGGERCELTVNGEPVAATDELRGLVQSIVQDLNRVPEEYLVPAGDGAYVPSSGSTEALDVWKDTYHEEGAYPYDEWDFRRNHYRKNWCILRELDTHLGKGEFVARTLHRYSGLVTEIRRTFEALRGEDKRVRNQPNGDDIDLDAVVQACADMRAGAEMSDRLFTKQRRLERDMAVVFMVDVSGSTKGWINDAERESLVLLCEALEMLGDRYAIYGFSGMTRKRCELYRVKRMHEPYNDDVKARIAGLYPQDYTRMGVTIRHLSRLLTDVDARTKLLITLSDGKPDDYDGYRGEYGIEDTRQALIEAKHSGIHPFCITIDSEAHEYLPHMYGAVNYTVIDDVRKLPLRVSDIYRRLTT